jgi:hypothetical protein
MHAGNGAACNLNLAGTWGDALIIY